MTTADKARAEALWASLREAFTNAEQAIKEIIETRAWEALGYESFADAWADRMVGVRLATDAMKAFVVYALFDANEAAEDAADAALVAERMANDDGTRIPLDEVLDEFGIASDPTPETPAVKRVYEQVGGVGSGVSPEAVAQLKRQRDNGVPAQLATVGVRSYRRQAPNVAEARYLVVELTPDELVQFKALSERANSNVKTEGAKAVRAWMRKLEEPR